MKSIDQSKEIAAIRAQYTAHTQTQLEQLKALDRKVKRPAMRLACCVGTLCALLLGSGMSLIMTDLHETLGLAQPLLPGLALGITGLVLACVNYPIYRRVLSRRRKQYAQQVIELSDSLLEK